MADNPRAFPIATAGTNNYGMTLRDYFAAKAMAAFLAAPTTTAFDNPALCAEWAYQQADAMLKAREQQ